MYLLNEMPQGKSMEPMYMSFNDENSTKNRRFKKQAWKFLIGGM